MAGQAKIADLYNENDRGAKPPDYSATEMHYRNDVLNKLQQDYMVREQTHMELNDMTFSEYYLINRQQDMAYNPPKKNRADVRISTGVVHEKDNTILSILTAMNFQPKVRVYDSDDKELTDAGVVMTAKLKKSLQKECFEDKLPMILRVNIAQGNAYVEEKRSIKYCAKKIQTNPAVTDPMKMKFKTVLEKKDEGCEASLLPNTAVYMANMMEPDISKQGHIFVVLHVPTVDVAAVFKDFPRWDNVPKNPTVTVPLNVNGMWGDYYLQQPMKDYTEVIMYQNKPKNEYQIYLNGVQMFPIDEATGEGFPLTHFSPTGDYTLIKFDNEPIPFFAVGKSSPSKNQVKEEVLNELLRLMVYKMRQSAKPPIGNNSEKVLQSNVWDPGVVTPNIRKGELEVLTPNAGITGADFQFYNLIQESISESSVSRSVEGTNQGPDITATQYLDQKRENLKKLGLSIDNTIAGLRKLYWTRLYNEIHYMEEGTTKKYDAEDQKFVDSLESFSIDETIDGSKGKLFVNFVEDNTERAALGNDYMKNLMKIEEKGGMPTRIMFARKSYIRGIINNLSNKIYIEVMSEPEGQAQSMLGALFNMLTMYANLRGGDTSNIDFEYLEKIIDDHSGFDTNKLFKKSVPQNPQLVPQTGAQGETGRASPPRPSMVPVNKTRQAPNRVLSDTTVI